MRDQSYVELQKITDSIIPGYDYTLEQLRVKATAPTRM